MHDVTDLRDLVPDEAEQLALSGYSVGDLLAQARRAAETDDLAALERLERELSRCPRVPGWP